MQLRSALRVALCALTLSVVLTAPAQAQRPERATVEFATIGALVLASYEGGDNATQLALPSGSSLDATVPSLRLTFWTNSPVMLDAAVGLVHASYEYDDLTFLIAEAGPSFDLTRSSSAGVAVGGVLGFLLASNGDTETEFYAGPQAIVRARINDHAVARFQGGLRLFLSDETGIDRMIEIGGGIGFFL